MASLIVAGDTSGTVTLQAPAIAGSTVLTLPTTSGTIVTTGGGASVPFAAGSAASPSITFTGDTNTGIFSPAADTIAFSEGGVESMRIDSSGNVGIGTSSPAYNLDISGNVSGIVTARILNNNSGSSSYSYLRIGNNANSDSGLLRNSSTNTSAYAGASSLNLYQGAVAPIGFVTNNVLRMSINAEAPILCLAGGNTSATGAGIAFPATQSASSDANTLDDYEEGTFTATLTAATPPSTPPTATSAYTKIGNIVTVHINVVGNTTGASGELRVTGLPFTAATFEGQCGSAWLLQVTSNAGQIPYIASGATQIVFLSQNAGNATAISPSSFSYVRLTITYFAA
jgi:hypothetical protein